MIWTKQFKRSHFTLCFNLRDREVGFNRYYSYGPYWAVFLGPVSLIFRGRS